MNKVKKDHYDVIIIGGGPAGSTTATTLAQRGHSVLVIEKAKFPRDHVGESLLPFCYEILDDLGVLDIMEKEYSRKPGVTFSDNSGTMFSSWCFSHAIKDDSYLSFHVHRAKFDDMLLRNSERHGVEVVEETRVISADISEAGGSKVLIESPSGESSSLTARFLIDASGQSSLLAKQMGTKKAYPRLSPRVAFSSHWKGAKLDEDLAQGNIKIIHLDGPKSGWVWMIPLGENRLSIGVALSMEYANEQRRILSTTHDNWQNALYLSELAGSPIATTITGGAEQWNPVVANGDFSYYAEEKYGENFAIVGDAAGFLDPIFSSGIYLGMKSGQLVADGVSEILNNTDATVLEKGYADIAGAYQLIEELIVTFYDPDAIKFAGAAQTIGSDYHKTETAFSIIHLILAGDFFKNHQKYLNAVELLKDKDMIDKYNNLIKHPEVSGVYSACRRETNMVAS
jgi:flavin-dependent dehydrogenase